MLRFTPDFLTTGESAPSTHWIVHGVHPRASLGVLKERKILFLQGNITLFLGYVAHSLVTVPTTLPKLQKGLVYYLKLSEVSLFTV